MMRVVLLLALFILSGTPAQSEQKVVLRLIPEGATGRFSGGLWQQTRLSPEPPEGLRKMPAGIASPLFGTIEMGPAEAPTRVFLVVDETAERSSRLLVDVNANGDLTDDPPATWQAHTYQGKDGQSYVTYRGKALVQVRYDMEVLALGLNFERVDRNDPARAFARNYLLYSADYAREGEIALGDHTFQVLLTENVPRGDFRGKRNSPAAGVRLLIDRNENGRFDGRGESYDIAQPFTHNGVTYEVVHVAPSGAFFTLRRSVRAVPEIPLPPDLRPGKKVPAFRAKTLAGPEVRFPEDYRGRLVLLHFWASWCGDCLRELPYLTQVYYRFREQGLDMLGVSLDFPNARLELFLKERQMTWHQIYDGRAWTTELAQKYLITSIPAGFLVDGDTGEIQALTEDLLHPRLEETLVRALRKKFPPASAEEKAGHTGSPGAP